MCWILCCSRVKNNHTYDVIFNFEYIQFHINDFAQVCMVWKYVGVSYYTLHVQFDAYRRDTDATVMRALEIANFMDSVSYWRYLELDCMSWGQVS